MTSSPDPKRRWDIWPVSIIAFFAVAILGCVGFVAFCNLHPSELVASDYYEQEIRFQKQMDRVARASQLERKATVTYSAAAKEMVLVFPKRSGERPTTGTIHLYRPSAAGLDRHIQISVDPEGNQRIDVAGLPSGLWKVKVSWVSGGQDYYLEESILVGAIQTANVH